MNHNDVYTSSYDSPSLLRPNVFFYFFFPALFNNSLGQMIARLSLGQLLVPHRSWKSIKFSLTFNGGSARQHLYGSSINVTFFLSGKRYFLKRMHCMFVYSKKKEENVRESKEKEMRKEIKKQKRELRFAGFFPSNRCSERFQQSNNANPEIPIPFRTLVRISKGWFSRLCPSNFLHLLKWNYSGWRCICWRSFVELGDVAMAAFAPTRAALGVPAAELGEKECIC